MTDTISLQYYLEKQLSDHKAYLEALIKHERDLRDVDNINNERALTIQAKEYERRLDNLNGEHGRLQEMTNTFLDKQTFQVFLKTTAEKEERERGLDTIWQRNVDRQLSEHHGATNRTLTLITIGLLIVSVALRFWH